jgi:hypothetical protein
MDYLVKAIHSLRPTAEFSYTNNDYSTIKWDVLEGDAPTQDEIDAEIAKIKSEELTTAADKAAAKAALLDRLGITAEEAALLLG